METINNLNFSISQCEIGNIMEEIQRFLFHITLVHIFSNVVDGKENLFGRDIFKTLIVTSIAILAYHILFKKIAQPKLKKVKLACEKGSNLRQIEAI